MILSQEYHQLHPSNNDNFRVNSNKTRLISFISLLRINSFCQGCYQNHWWWYTVSVNSKTWMVTERHDFLSLMFRFVACVCMCVCVCVCVCVFVCVCTRFVILFMSPFLILPTDYLSLLRVLFILFWYCFYSFCWKNGDSKYRKFRNKTRNNKKSIKHR